MQKKNIIISIISIITIMLSTIVIVCSTSYIYKDNSINYENLSTTQKMLYTNSSEYTSLNNRITALEAAMPSVPTTNPEMDGTVAIGTSTNYARADHVHPSDTTKANLASPTLTGTPTAPTAAAGTNTTQLATTAFVNTAVTNGRANIGTEYWDAPSAVSVATATAKTVAKLTLPAGVYVFTALATFPANTTGYRYTLITTATNATTPNLGIICASRVPAVTQSGQNTQEPIMCSYTATASATYYLIAYQNSGSALSVNGYFSAVRIK